MKNRTMLKDIKLEVSSNGDILDRMMQATARIEAQDQAVFDYIKIRGSNQDFRNKVKEALKTVQGRRGPKPDGLSPVAFFELIKAIKKSYQLKNNGLALETYCKLHGLPLERASSLEDKYRRGREEKTKNKGG
jgi:murein L,D-transpeptidase YcbB/YkuD